MVAYRRAIKMAIANTMRMGAEGIKIQISGRLNGAEMARKEMYKEGRTPLHTFRADIDYCQTEALTKVGLLGIKVWICRGEIYGKKDLAPNFVQQNVQHCYTLCCIFTPKTPVSTADNTALLYELLYIWNLFSKLSKHLGHNPAHLGINEPFVE